MQRIFIQKFSSKSFTQYVIKSQKWNLLTIYHDNKKRKKTKLMTSIYTQIKSEPMSDNSHLGL